MSSKVNRADTSAWDSKRGMIHSRKGGWLAGQGAFSHGYSITEELVGQVSYFQVLMLNILGYIPERRLADWLEAVYECLSWPDPRIWCNQIGALAGTAQTSTVAATVAGVLAADSTMYGSRPVLAGVRFIQDALAQRKTGISTEEIVAREVRRSRGKVRIMGYARPLASGDERVVALERVAEQLKFSVGEHLQLAYDIEAILQRDHGESMNINGYASAFLSDLGFNAQEIYALSALCVASGVTACYLDSRSKPPESFLPLRCSDIEYQGKPARDLP